MSVFVDVAPDDSAPAARGAGSSGSLTRAALPALSVLAFFGVWQAAAATGIWNQTFVPYPSTVWRAFVDTSTFLGHAPLFRWRSTIGTRPCRKTQARRRSPA